MSNKAWLERLYTKICWWLARRLPKELVYFCTIRLWAYATTGKYSSTVVTSLSLDKALRRWENLGDE